MRYPIDYNIEAIKFLIYRAMDLGYYEGVNLSLAYCDDCGHQELEMECVSGLRVTEPDKNRPHERISFLQPGSRRYQTE